MELIKTIRENRLIYLPLDKLSKKLSTIVNLPVEKVKNELLNLINSGDLFLDETGKISISLDRGFYKSKIRLNKKGYGFAIVEGYPDFFIPAFAVNGAFDGDDCLVEITSKKFDGEIEARVVSVIHRNTTRVVGTYIVGKSKNVVFPDDAKLPQIRIYKNDSANAQNNEKVWVEIDVNSIENNIMRGKIIEVLGKANTPKAEQLSLIRAFNLVDKFDDKVLNEVKSINQTVDLKNFKKRKDYTSQKVITIDGEDARDFDDAIAVETVSDGYILYVHIADVSNYVVENSALDKSALSRGTSVYFPNMVIPMLPKEISNGICSLSEGVNRLVLTCEIKLDKSCEVKECSIHEGVIKSHHRMTYTEVQNILNGDELLIEKYYDIYPDILTYQNISNELSKQKLARGEIRMNLPEPFILENSQGEIVSIENRVQDQAHNIIENLMVLTNECVAKKFKELNVPFVYRIHEKPDQEKIKKLSQLLKNLGVANQLEKDGDQPISYQKIIEKINGSPKEKILTKLILRTMMKAKYSPNCLGHFGIASDNYCHFTSPIRRYPDLQIHRIIKQYINGVPVSDLKFRYADVVARVSEQSSETEKNADEAEREMDDYKKAVYMTQFIGKDFIGIISGVQEFGIFVELDNGVEGMVKLECLPEDEYVYDDMNLTLYGERNHFTIGDKIRIVVANSSPQLRQIDFDLFGVEKGYANCVTKKSKLEENGKKGIKNNKKFQKKRKKRK